MFIVDGKAYSSIEEASAAQQHFLVNPTEEPEKDPKEIPMDPSELLDEEKYLEDVLDDLKPLAREARARDVSKEMRANKILHRRLQGFYEMSALVRTGMSLEDAFEEIYATNKSWQAEDKEELRDALLGPFSDIDPPRTAEFEAGKGLWAMRRKFAVKHPTAGKKFKLWLDKGLTKAYIHLEGDKKFQPGFDILEEAILFQRKLPIQTYIKTLSPKEYTFWEDSGCLKPFLISKKNSKFHLGADSRDEVIKYTRALVKRDILPQVYHRDPAERRWISDRVSEIIREISAEQTKDILEQERQRQIPDKKYQLWIDKEHTIPYLHVKKDDTVTFVQFDDLAKILEFQRMLFKKNKIKTYIPGISSAKYTFWADEAKTQPFITSVKGEMRHVGTNDLEKGKQILEHLLKSNKVWVYVM